jgi:hypothetical protein
LEVDSSPVSHDQVEASLDCQLFAPELSGKQLELSKEMAPKLRVAGRWDFDQPGQRAVMLFKITKTQNLPPEGRRPSSEAAAIKALGNSGGVKAINVP